MRYLIKILFFQIAIFLPIILTAQHKRTGIPFVTNFSPLEYKAGNQNWAITQDSRGIMYFGNTAGILEFDGTIWKIIDPVSAIAFAKDKNEKIFVGGRGDFGYLAPDSAGNIKFISLLALVPEPHKDVNNIWTLECVGDKVYFSSVNGKLYVYENNNISIIDLDRYLGCIKYYQNKIFLECTGGLYTLENNFPVEIEGGNLLNNSNIRNMFDFGEDSLLIVTRSKGLYIYNKNKISKWETTVSPYIEDYQVYLATQLSNGFIAFGTVESGVIIMDKKGEPTQHINRYGGMINDDHCGIFTDKQGNIWSGLEFGISYLHVNSPWSVFNELAGLSTATFFSVAILNDKLYAGNAQGLFSKSWKINDNPLKPEWKFISQDGLDARKVWDILPIQNDLIFSSSNVGTYCIGEKPLYKIADYTAPFKFFEMSNKQYVLGAGEHAGVFVFEKLAGQWKIVSENKKIGYIESFEEDKNGNIWACDSKEKIIELMLQNDSVSVINTFDSTTGLPNDALISVLKLYDKILVGSQKGTFIFNENIGKFQPCDEINAIIGKDFFITSIKKDINEKHWFWGFRDEYEVTGYFEKKAEKITCKIIHNPVNKINEFANNSFYPVDESNMFVGSSNSLIHFNPSITIDKPFFNVLIRYVSLPINNDSLIFNGTFVDKNGNIKSHQDINEKIIVQYEFNSIKFGFSATYYEEYQRNMYSYKLEGFDTEWSSWSKKTEKEYTNLPEGNYTFLVKAKNLYDYEPVPASYKFNVKPPWYRTVLAYFAYLILFVLLIYIIVKLSVRKIEKEKIKLEKIVQQRTAEISLKNISLEQQKEEILTQNEVLNQQNEEITTQRDEIESQRDLVVKQKEEIEIIHNEITQSIDYATKIQASILPEVKILQSHFSDQFILFKPKDKVSGDFYWWAKVEEQLIIAVADCTGHGVPGAFMSMLGTSFLREIVIKEYMTKPSIILRRLRKEVIKTLKQKGVSGEQKDGMDISLIAIKLHVSNSKSQASSPKLQEEKSEKNGESEQYSLTSKQLAYNEPQTTNEILKSSNPINPSSDIFHAQWAGANNPLWLVRAVTQSSGLLLRSEAEILLSNEPEVRDTSDASANNELQTTTELASSTKLNNELFELKPDKMPIAIYERMDDFTNHELQLQKGDSIYLMSDGYEDQFGGPKGKKFLSKNLKKLLLENASLSMSEQREILNSSFEKWKGRFEQIDDITILGIKL